MYFNFAGSIITDSRQMEQSGGERGSKCIIRRIGLVRKYKGFGFFWIKL